jgi:RNA-directed DNA polymerase
VVPTPWQTGGPITLANDRRVVHWWKKLHRWRWKDIRRHLTDHTGRWRRPSADGIELFNLAKVPITRYRYRGNTIPNPWTQANPA